jgi:hypothetical protein
MAIQTLDALVNLIVQRHCDIEPRRSPEISREYVDEFVHVSPGDYILPRLAAGFEPTNKL